MYRNLHYNIYNKTIRVWSWDEKGKRIHYDVPYFPYLYVETDKQADEMSIFHTKLKKMGFKNEFERRKYVKESGIKRIFYNLPVEQQFLIDHYKFQNSEEDFNKYPLKIFLLDIECPSKEGFPEPSDASVPVNVITIYDSISEKFYSWGTGGNYNAPENVVYTQCETEQDLFLEFLSFWRKDFPDILSGWNSASFDLPYIINRINNLFGEDKANLLSPVGKLYKKDDVKTKFGKYETRWEITGISHIDYLDAYKTFERENREGYSLNFIGSLEVDETKVDIKSSDLYTLAKEDWQKFCDYNIQDVNIIVKLEEKKHYLRICRNLAYMGYTKFEKALGKVSIVCGGLALEALKDNTIIPTFQHQTSGKYIGGHVREPIRGLSESVVSFDANSLYPSAIITSNISPETKLGKIISSDEEGVTFSLENGTEYTLPNEKFLDFVTKEKVGITRAKIMYSQKKIGFCARFVDNLYKKRVEYKTEMLKHEKNLPRCKEGSDTYISHKKRIVELDIMQYNLKILLNSLYGTFGTPYSPFYDVDAAKSITLNGQACIKESFKIVDKFMKDRGIDDECVVYSDTDSVSPETKIETNKYDIQSIEALYSRYWFTGITEPFMSKYGHQIIDIYDGLKVKTFDSKTNEVKYGNVKRLVRHKVTKKKYKIMVGGKEVYMTEDHGCMVMRNGDLIRVSPSEIQEGDKMVIMDD